MEQSSQDIQPNSRPHSYEQPSHYPLPNIYDMDKRLALLELGQLLTQKELQGISNNTSKLVWIVMGALIVGLLNLLMKAV